MMRTPTALVLAMFATGSAACGGSEPGTSVEVNLIYDDTLGLDTAEVTVVDRTESARIAHRLFLLVPDTLAAMDMPIEVWGRKAGKRAAYGAATAVPVLGKTNTATVTLSACSPGCQGAMLTTCTGPVVACPLGCSEDGDAHCIVPRPSNGVDPELADRLLGTTTIAADTTFDTDTGAITGGLVRASGVGDGSDDGVGYQQQAPLAPGNAQLGVFVFHNLTIDRGVTVQFTGSRAVVLLVGDAAKIGGTLDLAAGQGARSAPGPGGGAGGTTTAPAQGCGAGGAGSKGTVSDVEDSGGGGAGGGKAGGRGGDAFSNTTPSSRTAGGLPGKQCLGGELQTTQLQGGSGGGAGSPGLAAVEASGGGGGGAIQITALGSLEVSGTIHAGGAGGEAGPVAPIDTTDAGSGGGGGSGGAILLESPAVTLTSSAVLAANGGGGGGASVTAQPGIAGENARASATSAAGGRGGDTGGTVTTFGGDGGTGTTAAGAGDAALSNGNGGGGAVGTITIRGRDRLIAGTISPGPVEQDIDVSQ